MVMDASRQIRALEIEVRALKSRLNAVMSGTTLIPSAIVGILGWASGGTGMSGSPLGVDLWQNQSGGVRTQGEVLIENGARTFTRTATQGDRLVIGVLDDASVAVGAEGRVRIMGYQSVVNVQGNVGAGNYLRTSTTIGRAEDAGATPGVRGIFGLALTAYGGGGAGQVAAFLFPEGGDVATDEATTFDDLLAAAFALTPTDLTIAAGAITVTRSHHRVDTQGAAATDDLDTINGGSSGRLLIIRPVSSARTVVIKHNTGNILTNGGLDISLDAAEDWAWLLYDAAATNWYAATGSPSVTARIYVPLGINLAGSVVSP